MERYLSLLYTMMRQLISSCLEKNSETQLMPSKRVGKRLASILHGVDGGGVYVHMFDMKILIMVVDIPWAFNLGRTICTTRRCSLRNSTARHCKCVKWPQCTDMRASGKLLRGNLQQKKVLAFSFMGESVPFPAHTGAYGTSRVFINRKFHGIVSCRYHDDEVGSENYKSIISCNWYAGLQKTTILYLPNE